MLFLLSPAKTLDYDTPSRVEHPTTPQFVSQSAELINLLKTNLLPQETHQKIPSPKQIQEIISN